MKPEFTIERDTFEVDIPEHLIVLHFNDDEVAAWFNEWLELEGRRAFEAWLVKQGKEDTEEP